MEGNLVIKYLNGDTDNKFVKEFELIADGIKISSDFLNIKSVSLTFVDEKEKERIKGVNDFSDVLKNKLQGVETIDVAFLLNLINRTAEEVSNYRPHIGE